ncbi:hypothetical protein TWF788_011150 [Orbilia oligospora]|uniref:Uncharacterized protein n=2 Tax=Orbilia oligospora TaxID=2813651 RepID=A0A7C8U976_ORBOL|nr:hypothetical protein TWF788_011150 [Orbilia oligospora]
MQTPSPWLEEYPALSDEIVREPCDYVKGLPSKKTLSLLIDGLNIWYNAPSPQVDIIKSICEMLHRVSLVIDDMQDNSDLRRGEPAAHMVFGVPQTINSATYLLIKCFEEASRLSPSAITVITQGVSKIHIGQGYDLHWTFHGEIPSEKEYIRMIDGKTGGFFPIAARLLRDEATQNKDLYVEDLLLIIGRFYQIRDDYMNLTSQEYTNSKGHLSDLDEGKYSLMLIHALNNTTEGTKLKSLLTIRSRQGNLSAEQKNIVMKTLARTKSMEYAFGVLEQLQKEMKTRLASIENQAGEESTILQAILEKLRVVDDITPEIIDDPGPFELPNNTITTITTATKGTDTMSSSPVHIPSRSPSPSDTDSYDRLSDIIPHSSPTMAHSAKWSGASIVSDDHFATTNSIPVAESPVYKTETRSGTRSKKLDIKIEPPPRFPVLPTEVMIEPNSATAPQPVKMMSWNRSSFSNPAIQEKLRQQSVLYHQIHDLLAERTRNRSVVEGNNLKLAGNLNQIRAPLSPIPEPTYKVEGVDHAKIQALKNKYPNKQALHKHLDSFSAIMSRFMALSAPDVSILDLKDPVFDEKKQTTERETDKARRSPRSSPRMDRPIMVSDSPTLPPLPRPSWHLADIPEEKLVDGV